MAVDKLDELEAILAGVLVMGNVAFATLEKLTGKCTSLSVAVPVASLYTLLMYKHIAQYRKTGGKQITAVILVPQRPTPRTVYTAPGEPTREWRSVEQDDEPHTLIVRYDGCLFTRIGRGDSRPSRHLF